MARYTGPSCRLCRREGKKLFLKGERCNSDKCAVTRNQSHPKKKGVIVPGQHGMGRKKVSEYGLQLRTKQSAKRYYGVSESQFVKYFNMAERQAGVTGENLLRILELRLDNFVYRAGFAASRKEARQLIRHGHFTLNGHKASIPSILLRSGDSIAVKTGDDVKVKLACEANSARPVVKWIDVDSQKLTAKVAQLPQREDVDFDVEEHLIVELYSK